MVTVEIARGWAELDGLTTQGSAQKMLSAVPSYVAARADGEVVVPGHIFDLLGLAWVGTRGASIEGRWRFLPERLVRADVVVLAAKEVEGALLCAAVLGRRRCGVGFQSSVEALLSPVLLRLAGGDLRIPLDPIACSGRTRSLVPEDPIT